MVAIAESIVHDVFADDGQSLTVDYISNGLNVFGKYHTKERLIAVLDQMIICGHMAYDDNTKTYHCIQ